VVSDQPYHCAAAVPAPPRLPSSRGRRGGPAPQSRQGMTNNGPLTSEVDASRRTVSKPSATGNQDRFREEAPRRRRRFKSSQPSSGSARA
jgi:hypothetical protein